MKVGREGGFGKEFGSKVKTQVKRRWLNVFG